VASVNGQDADRFANVAGALERNWQVPAFRQTRWQKRQHAMVVIIPVINEGARLRRLLQRMAELRAASLVDLVVVDGGSTDGSVAAQVLRPLSVRALLEKTGPGKLSAQLRCGYAWALGEGYEAIITIDGNDKDDPAAVPSFVEALQQGADFVQGSRYVAGGRAENTPRLRDVAIRYLHAPALAWASGFPWTDTTQGFRGYSRRLLEDPRVAPFRDVFSAYELLAYLSYKAPRLGYRCLELPTTRRYPSGKVPTKIGLLRGNFEVFKVLLRSCLGGYNPATVPD
jgi:glycosyltransferase involved in cell wall biosynthesis